MLTPTTIGSTTSAITVPPTATAPRSDPPRLSPSTSVPDESGERALTAGIEDILRAALAPGSIRWENQGVNAPATAAVAAVRIPGRTDVLVAVGANPDGSPAEADAPFLVGSLVDSLVRTIAFQMVDEGLLDPTLTVDEWVPTLPNADRVTVQMLLDNNTGWSEDGPISPDPVLADTSRVWGLREVVELLATVMTPVAEPGTVTNDALAGEQVLALVVQEVGGRPLAELVHERVSEPVGLDQTSLGDGQTHPDGFRHGIIVAGGTVLDSSAFEPVSFMTWNQATRSAISTPSDLLDLLDAWAYGTLFTTDRVPSADRLAPDPAGDANTFVGVGVPINAYCPCTDIDGAVQAAAIGRVPGVVGSRTVMLHYDDGISVIVNVNSNESSGADIRQVADQVHEVAASAI
jgi:CubicO group peptidase (beta-lactamase class C family)